MKFWLRACPKCAGDLELQHDIAGPYIHCVQCGLELSPGQVRRLYHIPAGPSGAVAEAASSAPRYQVA